MRNFKKLATFGENLKDLTDDQYFLFLKIIHEGAQLIDIEKFAFKELVMLRALVMAQPEISETTTPLEGYLELCYTPGTATS